MVKHSVAENAKENTYRRGIGLHQKGRIWVCHWSGATIVACFEASFGVLGERWVYFRLYGPITR